MPVSLGRPAGAHLCWETKACTEGCRERTGPLNPSLSSRLPPPAHSVQQLSITGNICWEAGLGYCRALAARIPQLRSLQACASHFGMFPTRPFPEKHRESLRLPLRAGRDCRDSPGRAQNRCFSASKERGGKLSPSSVPSCRVLEAA